MTPLVAYLAGSAIGFLAGGFLSVRVSARFFRIARQNQKRIADLDASFELLCARADELTRRADALAARLGRTDRRRKYFG